MNSLNFLADIFFPRQCVVCDKGINVGAICPLCFASISLYDAFFCGTCKARLPYGKKICHKSTPYILGSAGSYRDPALEALVRSLKFQNIRDAAEPLAECIVRYLSRCNISLMDYIIVPLPLAKSRERDRGFNQSLLIARGVAARLGLSLVQHALDRKKHTRPQTETSGAAERFANIRGCFIITHPEFVTGKKILLVDDVTTSGATFGEAARMLKAAGAKKIIALAAGKA